jgi:hypothetical protein
LICRKLLAMSLFFRRILDAYLIHGGRHDCGVLEPGPSNLR